MGWGGGWGLCCLVVALASGGGKDVQHGGKEGVDGFFGAACGAGKGYDEGVAAHSGDCAREHGVGGSALAVCAGGFGYAGYDAVDEGRYGFGGDVSGGEAGASGDYYEVEGVVAEVLYLLLDLGDFVGNCLNGGGGDVVFLEFCCDGFSGLVGFCA